MPDREICQLAREFRSLGWYAIAEYLELWDDFPTSITAHLTLHIGNDVSEIQISDPYFYFFAILRELRLRGIEGDMTVHYLEECMQEVIASVTAPPRYRQH